MSSKTLISCPKYSIALSIMVISCPVAWCRLTVTRLPIWICCICIPVKKCNDCKVQVLSVTNSDTTASEVTQHLIWNLLMDSSNNHLKFNFSELTFLWLDRKLIKSNNFLYHNRVKMDGLKCIYYLNVIPFRFLVDYLL